MSILLCSLSIIGTATETVIKGFPPVPIFHLNSIDFFKLMEDYVYTFFFRPMAHLSSYTIGIVTGVFISHKITLDSHAKISGNHRMPLWLNVTGWTMSIVCKLAIIWAVYPWNKGDSVPTVTVSALYACSCRTIWSLTHSWDVIAGVMGGGGLIVRLMSWRPFIPLARMTYSVYLIAPLIMIASAAANRAPYHFTHFLMFQRFLGFLPMSYGCAFIITLVIEGPLVSLEKVVKDKWSLTGHGKAPSVVVRTEQVSTEGTCSSGKLQNLQEEMHQNLHRVQEIRTTQENKTFDCFSFASLTLRRSKKRNFGADLSEFKTSSNPKSAQLQSTPSSASHHHIKQDNPKHAVSSMFRELNRLPSLTDSYDTSQEDCRQTVENHEMTMKTTINSSCFNNFQSVGQMTQID